MQTLLPVPPSQHDDPAIPVKRHLISAGVLIAVAGLLFAGIGVFSSDTPADSPAVAAPVDLEPAPRDDIVSPDPAEPETSSPEVAATPSVTEPDAAPSAQASPAATAAAAPPEPEPEPDPEPASNDGRIDPSSISVQILDAVKDDDRAAATKVGDDLKDDDYNVIVTNAASKVYEKTTVMYSAGFEAQARQIAADYGFTEVRLKPDNLTDGVQVHLVVGLDAR